MCSNKSNWYLDSLGYDYDFPTLDARADKDVDTDSTDTFDTLYIDGILKSIVELHERHMNILKINR